MKTSIRVSALAILSFSIVATLHCGPGRQRVTVMIPPRVELAQLERIGVVEFRATGKDELGRLATQRFTESARRDQGLVRMLDLGQEQDALRSIGLTQWEPEAYQALGDKREVQTILTGELTFARARPNVSVASDLGSGSVSMNVRATLAVQLIEAESGAAIWSRTASASRSLGNVDVIDIEAVRVATGDPAAAYGDLVDSLVSQVTGDFHAHWERR